MLSGGVRLGRKSLEYSIQPWLFSDGGFALSLPAPFLRLCNPFAALGGEVAILFSAVLLRSVGVKSIGWGAALEQRTRLFQLSDLAIDL
jgi:hypothetical protein